MSFPFAFLYYPSYNLYYVCFEKRINEFWENGQLSEKKKLEYEARLTRYKRELEGFTHKDQKPYWS